MDAKRVQKLFRVFSAFIVSSESSECSLAEYIAVDKQPNLKARLNATPGKYSIINHMLRRTGG